MKVIASRMPVLLAAGITGVLLPAVLPGCAPDQFDNIRELDVVATTYREGYDFSKNRTFAMPDEILDLGDTDTGSGEYERDTQYDQDILDRIAANMARLGYDRLADPQDPDADVIVTAGVVSESWWAWGYYCWYYYPYYGHRWCYPSNIHAIEFPVGSLLIHMADPEEGDAAADPLPVAWSAGMRAVLENRSIDDLLGFIDQAFDQSEWYLRVGEPAGGQP